MLNLLALGNSQRLKHAHQLLGTEKTHQVIFQRNIKSGFSRISLTAGTASQLIVNTPGLMPFGSDDLQAAGLPGRVVQLDIGTTTCHVGRYSYRSCLSGMGDDFRLHLVELGIQYLVRNALPFQHAAEQLGSINIHRADQHRLVFLVRFLDLFHNRVIFFLLGHVDGVFMIHTDHRFVGGDLYHIHSVDVTEFLLLCQSRTGHTGLLFILIKEILEGNRREGLALTLDFHMLLCLDCLMQSVGITSARKHTSGKFIDNQNLVILHNIVPVAEHQIMRPQRKNNIVLDIHVFRV